MVLWQTSSWHARPASTSTWSNRCIHTTSTSCYDIWAPSRGTVPSRGDSGKSSGPREPLVERRPVRVGEKRFDVLRALRRRVVQQKGVFPHVHHEDGRVACD